MHTSVETGEEIVAFQTRVHNYQMQHYQINYATAVKRKQVI